MTEDMGGSEDATKHTAVIGTVIQMWEKLAWDIDVFEDIQRSYPDEKQPLGYAAINVCIAAASLADWVVKEIGSRFPEKRKIPWESIRDQLAFRVPQSHMCRAIANTAKHRELQDHQWVGGRVDLIEEEADEDSPGGYALYHYNDGQSGTLAFNSFQALKRAWWDALVAEGIAEGQMPTPQWLTKKLERIFRPIASKLPHHTLRPVRPSYPQTELGEE